MKIVRHVSPQGPAYAALQPDGSAYEISGNILGSFHVTKNAVTCGKLLTPVVPPCIMAIGLNYAKHAAEGAKPPPPRPMWFIKLPGTLQNPGDPITLPTQQPTASPDFEAELAIVIGREAKNVSKARAMDYILGFTCANDVSARDWQRDLGGGQFCHGKGFDTFCPLGPVLVTPDEIGNPNALRIRSFLNGTLMQDASTSEMIFDVPTIIEFLTADKTLAAGTVILTGTPDGVGFARKPPVWLKAGDTIEIDIEKIGRLSNPVK